LTSLDVSNNGLGNIVGWTHHPGNADHAKYVHSDGRRHGPEEPPEGLGKREGIIALANAIKDMGPISSVNVLGNSIGVEQAQELIKILHNKEKLTTLCGFSGDEIDLNLNKKNLSAGCGVLVANEISDMRALVKFDISNNYIGAGQKDSLQRICVASGIDLAM
jgi:Ran GTPase-activating protein (RanGAP) involved in mRNA processing and transport